MKTLAEVANEIGDGQTTSRDLVEACLERIDDPSGEGSRVFLSVAAEKARAAAAYHDRLRQAGAPASCFAGIPISIKDLFDIAGEVTTAGSTVLRNASPAPRDAVAVARLRAAGMIPIGRTNMSEFAFSGLGINPHYGTPSNPFDRATGRIPGGSTSGGAVSVTDGMAFAALGTDTGGSCRIPAALCGIVGFKPTAERVELTGAMPLSTSLDSIGPLAPTVRCCAALDAILAGEGAWETAELQPAGLAGLRLAVPQTLVLDGIDPMVAHAFDAALRAVGDAGARIADLPLREFAELAAINAKGGFPAAEAFAFHRPLIAEKGQLYDPRVLTRIQRGREQDAADYIELCRNRLAFIRRVDAATAEYDALVMPTVPIVAPPLAELGNDEAYGRINLLMLRNPTVANFIDGCAISLPCHRPGEAPVGLMLVGRHGADRRLLAIAAAVEAALSRPLAQA